MVTDNNHPLDQSHVFLVLSVIEIIDELKSCNNIDVIIMPYTFISNMK